VGLITATLSDSFARDVTAREQVVAGVRVVEVTVRAPLPVIGPVGPAERLTVSGRAFSERQLYEGAP
jgi:hypothetical protein